MFGIGAFELFAVLVVALIVLGPDRLPKAMGTVGKWVRELRRLTREFRKEFDEEIRMLQGEMEMLREEAELTRKELEEIRADIVQSMGDVQKDLESAGQDIKEELTAAEGDIRGDMPVPMAGAGWPRVDTKANWQKFESSNGASLDPVDAMYAAIVEAFAEGDGHLPAEIAPIGELPKTNEPRGFLDLGAEWERIQNEAQVQTTANAGEPARAPLSFAPLNDQFGALLKVIGESGEAAVAAARDALAVRGERDASKLVHLYGKGPAGLAFAWAAQRQGVVDPGTVEVSALDSSTARIRLLQCPYGLTGPEGLAVCELSNVYDLALAGQMGLQARYERRITKGDSCCELLLEQPRAASAEADGPNMASAAEGSSASTADGAAADSEAQAESLAQGH